MSRAVVLVNGVPASGKSSVARVVSAARMWPLLSIDVVKEPFFTYLGTGDRDYNRKLGRASYHAIFDLIGRFPPGLNSVVDAWFGFQPVEVLREHLARAGVDKVLEIWCEAPPAVIGARYAARVDDRPPGHPGLEYVPELVALAGRARPLDIAARLTVDTTLPLDESALTAWIDAELAR